jgi:hypothetical protein
MSQTCYKIRFKKGDFEVEVQGDREFVLTKFEELTKGKITSVEIGKEEVKTGEFPASLAEFVKMRGDPKEHTDLAMIFAYWLFKRENMESFNVKDLENCYSQTRIPKPANLSDVMNRNQGKGLVVRTEGRKDNLVAWAITRSGEEYVEKMKAN